MALNNHVGIFLMKKLSIKTKLKIEPRIKILKHFKKKKKP